jgi:hypothetical protein
VATTVATLLLGSAAGGVATLRSPQAAATATASTCSLVPPSLLKSTLGLKVGSPKVVVNGTVTVCSYPKGTNPQAVIVRFEKRVTTSMFTAYRKSDQKHGEKITILHNFDPHPAYLGTIGNAPYVTDAVNVLKRSTYLQVTTGLSTTRKIYALVHKVLRKL